MQVVPDLGKGGITQVVRAIAGHIDRDRFDFSILTLNFTGEFEQAMRDMGVPIFSVERPTDGPDYFAFRKVARILRAKRIDAVHTHNTQAFMDGALGAKLARVRTIVHSDHARLFPDKRRYMFAEHCLSYLAYRVVGVSEPTSENLVRYERIPRRKVVTVANGIEASRFDLEVDRAAKLRELGLDGYGPVLGTGARLVEQKNFPLLLQTVARLTERFPSIALVIAGEGPLKDSLTAQAERLGIGARVRLLGMRYDMPELLRTFDVYVMSSDWEGLPMALLEAMAARAPVVSTAVGGVTTAVQHGVNGSLVPPGSSDRLAEAVAQVLTDRELRDRYVAAGRRAVETTFSAQHMTRQYEALYLRQPLPTAADGTP